MTGKLPVVFAPVSRPTRTNIDNYETTERKEGLLVVYLYPKVSSFCVSMTTFLFFC